MGAKRLPTGQTTAHSSRNPTKIVVIGVTGLAGVRCLDWLSLREVPNLADFQVVVVSTPALSDQIRSLQRESQGASGEGLDALRKAGSRLSDDLSLLKRKLLQVLRARGTVYGTVGPFAIFAVEDPYWRSIVESRQWIPLPVDFRDEPGNTLRVRDPRFSRYFASVSSWQEVLEVGYDAQPGEDVSYPDAEAKPLARLVMTSLATDWQGNAVAAALEYVVHRRLSGHTALALARAVGAGDYEEDPYFSSGSLVLLPPATEVSDEETVRILLEDFCGVTARSVAPKWAQAIQMPGDGERKAAIAEATKRLDEAQRERRQALDAQAEADEFKGLLYEKHLPLQQIARKTFEAMGVATVDSPVSDEFMLVWDEEKVLVEVTGAGKSIAGRDLSQLMKDLSNYLAEMDQDIKGVLVGNAWVALPPGERGTPDKPIFPDNVQKAASNRGIALVSTLGLFKAYCAFLEGKVTADQVFRRIADGIGLIDLVD